MGALLLAGSWLVASGCGNSASTSTSLTAPSSPRCQPDATASPTSFAAAGGTGAVTVSVSRECSWSAASEVQWIAITSSAGGQGEGTVGYRVAENHEPVARQAAILVNDRRVALSQQAAPCRFQVIPAALEPVPSSGGVVNVDVRTHRTCAWRAATEVAWASVTPDSGQGDGTVRISVTANSGAERSVELLVAGTRLSGRQHGAATAPAPSPSPSPSPLPSPSPSPGPPSPPNPNPDPAPNPPPDPTPGGGQPTPVRSIELDGPISGLSGACPEVTFRVRGQDVYTTASTRYDDLSCTRLRNGMKVDIEGMLMSDGRVRADQIERDD